VRLPRSDAPETPRAPAAATRRPRVGAGAGS